MSGWTIPGYTPLTPLGAGGFGAVIMARHDPTGTPVAIKYLRPDLVADPGFGAMFRGEAVTLGSIDSPYVVRLYEYVESPAGAAIVMELVDGVSLRELLTRPGRTTPEAALVVLYGSLLGLAAVHARGIVHRDYKPGNILVNAYGASKLTDFGIAARSGRPTFPAGSLSYAPPEQFGGAPASPASDIYAATATFYECLTGHPPFQGSTTEALIFEHQSKPAPMDQVPGPLRPFVAAGLAKDPRYRPADASAFAAGLRAAAAGAYGPDWEERGRGGLSAAAFALAALWPTGGAPAAAGLTTEQVQLARGYHPAGHGAGQNQGGPYQAGQNQAMSPHRRHVRHEKHLAHLRRLRAAAAGAAAAAVIAAGATYALAGSPSGVGASGSDPAQAGFSVPLQTIPVTASSSAAPVSGDTFVYYKLAGDAQATLTGTIENATAGEVVRVYARQFPYTGKPVLAGTSPVSPSGGSAGYSFTVAPALATRYQVELFNNSSDTSPIGESASKTIYVVFGSPYLHVNCKTGAQVCAISLAETFYAPPGVIAQEMAKRWYIYAGVNIQPGTSTPPNPTTLTLGGLSSSVSHPVKTGRDSFTMAIKLRYNDGGDQSTFVWWSCRPDTEAQNGFGLPGSHSCGTKTTIPTDIGYIG